MTENKDLSPHLGDYFLQITDTFFCIIKEEKITYLNDAAINLLEGSKDELINQHYLNIVVDADKEYFEERMQNITARTEYFPLRLKTPTEAVAQVKARLVPLLVNNEKICMLEAYDQKNTLLLEKKNKVLEEKVTHLSPLDLETHLPTPILFNDRVDQAILRALREARGVLTNISSYLTVVVVNVDGLQDIEHKLGVEAKRYVVDILVSRFKSTIRSVDTVAKPPEDAFYFLFENIRDKKNVQIIIDRLKNCASVPISFKNQSISLKFTVGLSIYPDNGTSPVSLLKWAKFNPTAE